MQVQHVLWYGNCYSDDQIILLCHFSSHHPVEALHRGFDVWGAAVGT
uniref:Uncharacterized protein n=1 Tax=Arundo donax TaxID=35708 RepID=A0A0A8YTC6_ARUDO